MQHKTFVKKDAAGNVIATIRVLHESIQHVPKDFEEIEDNPDIASHTEYYAKKRN